MYKTKLPTGVRILLGFLSIVLCLILFASTLVTILVADVRLVTSKDGLQTIITQALFPKSAPVRLPAPGLAAGVPVRLEEADTNNEAQGAIVEAIYGMITEQFGDELPISQEQVEEFLSESTLPEFLTEKVAGVVNDIYTGESTTTITKEEIVQLLQENAPIIQEQLGVTITDQEIAVIGDWVEENKIMDTVQQQVSEITGMAPPAVPGATGPSGDSSRPGASSGSAPSGTDVITGIINGGDVSGIGVPELLAVVRTVTSVSALLICLGSCLVLIGLLFLTHWGRPFAAMRTAGIPVMIAGIFMAVPSILAMAAPSIFTGTVMIIVRQILGMTGYVSIGTAVLGLVLIITGAVLNSKYKKAAKAALQAAGEEEKPAEDAPAETVTLEEAPAVACEEAVPETAGVEE